MPGGSITRLDAQAADRADIDVVDDSYLNPFCDCYWRSKTSRVEDITIPAYVVASVSNALHTRGTFDGFRRLGPQSKWLRVHNTMEWDDYYAPDHVDDLRRFFDRYLKDEPNGWESTSPARYAILDLGGRDVVGLRSETWPPEGVTHRELHIDPHAGSLTGERPETAGETVYDSGDVRSSAAFDLAFDVDTEIVGNAALSLWISADDTDDLDVFVALEKVSRKGRVETRMIFNLHPLVKAVFERGRRNGKVDEAGFGFWSGPGGRIRASRRELDEATSTPEDPRLAHRTDLATPRGVPVRLDIALWPTSVRWRAGETLRLTVRGQDPAGAWFPTTPAVSTLNSGTHRVRGGGESDSTLLLPVLRRI